MKFEANKEFTEISPHRREKAISLSLRFRFLFPRVRVTNKPGPAERTTDLRMSFDNTRK